MSPTDVDRGATHGQTRDVLDLLRLGGREQHGLPLCVAQASLEEINLAVKAGGSPTGYARVACCFVGSTDILRSPTFR